MDLIVRGGLVATGVGATETDIGILDGRIAQLGGSMRADRELDAAGLVITPGGVDAHTHLTMPNRTPGAWRWCDDFKSGTASALAGGITTVGNMSFPENNSMTEGLALDLAEAGRLSISDYFMHPVLTQPTEDNLGAIEGLFDEGHTSLKFFLSFPSFDREVQNFLEAMRVVARKQGIALVHCEDAAIMECCCNILREEGRLSVHHYPDARPVQAEAVAAYRAVGFAESTGCPIYVVHLSSQRALDACLDGRSRGLPVYVETRPIYLHLTAERFTEPDGAKYAGAPPLRTQADVDRLWAGLQFGDIDTIATDHAPWSLQDKLDPELDATSLRQGVADLQTCLPMLVSAGLNTGRITLEQFVAVTSTTPAKLFGLYPQKGCIAVGADADLVVWDLQESRVIDGASMHTRADYTPYDGMEVTGWPRWTLSRGEVVVERDEIAGTPGRGRLVRRGPHRPR